MKKLIAIIGLAIVASVTNAQGNLTMAPDLLAQLQSSSWAFVNAYSGTLEVDSRWDGGQWLIATEDDSIGLYTFDVVSSAPDFTGITGNARFAVTAPDVSFDLTADVGSGGQLTYANGALTVTPIPEPSSNSVFFCLAALALLSHRFLPSWPRRLASSSLSKSSNG